MSEKSSNNWVKALSEAVNMVTSLAAAVGLCTIAGYFLDKKLETNPWLTVLGGILGIATAMKMIMDRVNKNDNKK